MTGLSALSAFANSVILLTRAKQHWLQQKLFLAEYATMCLHNSNAIQRGPSKDHSYGLKQG